jgi:hypothetical protein
VKSAEVNDLQAAVDALKRDPRSPVRARVGDMTVELRAVTEPATEGTTAAEIFDELGPWEGESTDELLSILHEARRSGGSRAISNL